MLEIDEPISIHSYDPSWPQLFAAEAACIAPGLPDAARIEHIGSTAVPGLDAKPIVDIMIGASSKADSPRIHSHLAYLGYEDLGEAGVPGRDYFRLRNRGMFNIALVALGGEHWRNNLALRDYLRKYPERAADYKTAKKAAVASGARMLLAYSEAKSAIIAELIHEAHLSQPDSSRTPSIPW